VSIGKSLFPSRNQCYCKCLMQISIKMDAAVILDGPFQGVIMVQSADIINKKSTDIDMLYRYLTLVLHHKAVCLTNATSALVSCFCRYYAIFTQGVAI
jgi:hypothetical protein